MYFSVYIQYKISSKFVVWETKMIPNYAATFHENVYCLCKQRSSSDTIRTDPNHHVQHSDVCHDHASDHTQHAVALQQFLHGRLLSSAMCPHAIR
jgi:hypothetical protein